MDSSLGARLRAQRERQQVALSAISDATKIKLPMLEALERDDVSQWPAGIYRRAYVRAYARAIGLDPEALVREFLELHPDPILVPPPAAETELESPPWPAGLHRLVTSAIAAIPSRRNGADADKSNSASPEASVTPQPERPVEPPAAAPREEKRRHEPGLQEAAELCTRLAQAEDLRDAAAILEDAAETLGAIGLIVWSWDRHAAVLRSSLACGYTDAALARMSKVRADADNAIASAFQSGQSFVVNGGDSLTGAVVVPLMSPTGCAGVLAIELDRGDEQRDAVRAFASILAAQLVPLVASVPLPEAVNA